MSDCVFCERVENKQYEHRYTGFGVEEELDVVRFEPLNPVTPGHKLFVPAKHLEWRDFDWESSVHDGVATAIWWATQFGVGVAKSFNIITSNGSPATQTIPHVHVHLVPRREGDGLHLPWTGQKK